MTQPNKSLLMNDACPHRPWWRKRAKLDDSWVAVCAWCRTRWDSSWYSPALSLTLSLYLFLSPSLFLTHALTHSQMYTKSRVLSRAVTLYKSPLSLYSHTVTLKMVCSNALCVLMPLFHSLVPLFCHSLTPSLFLLLPFSVALSLSPSIFVRNNHCIFHLTALRCRSLILW